VNKVKMSEEEDDNNQTPQSARQDTLGLFDNFIEHMQQIRRILLGMSVSAIVIAPLSIALSIYVLLHPSFFAVLEMQSEFGLVLCIFLGSVITISGIWFFTGIKQYRSIAALWQSRYNEYVKEKNKIDKEIASRFGLDEQE
jgi:hypothetical protein